jgi:hypothetical protein
MLQPNTRVNTPLGIDCVEASGGGAFLNWLDPAEGALIRAAASNVGHLRNLMRTRLTATLLVLLAVVVSPLPELFAQTKPTTGVNCEDALALIDTAAVEVMNKPDENVIAIARLGDRELSRRLNQQRLNDVMARLFEKTRNHAVGATGRRVNGQGRVELYVHGKLAYVILFPTNRRIDCRPYGG